MIKKRIAELGLVVGSLILGLLIFELIVGSMAIDINPNGHSFFNDRLGWTQYPNSAFISHVVDGKPIRVKYNRLGIRDREHTLRKRDGRKRIVIIGDSFSEAAHVNFNDTFFRVLEKRLETHTGASWETINLGVSDFGTTQALLALEQFGFAYDPDLVVLQIFPLNDICNNTIELYELCKSMNDRYRPYLLMRGNDDFAVAWSQPIRHWLRSNLASYGLIERYVLEISKRDAWIFDDAERIQEMKARGYPAVEPLINAIDSPEKQVEPVIKGWFITEQIIRRIARRCEQHKTPLIAVSIPFEQRVGKERFPVDYPGNRLRAIFARLDIAFISMKATFDAHTDEVLPYWGGHLNVAGHRLTADALYKELISRGAFSTLPGH